MRKRQENLAAAGLTGVGTELGDAFKKKGVDPAENTFKVRLLIDRSGSMRRYYDNGTVQRAISNCAGLIGVFDDDGHAPVTFFGTDVYTPDDELTLNPPNLHTYVADNAPGYGGTNLEGALAYTITELATDLGNPDIAQLATMPYDQLRPITAEVASLILFFFDGLPGNPDAAMQYFARLSHTGAFVGGIFIGNDSDGKKFMKRVDKGHGGLCDNVSVIEAGNLEKFGPSDLVKVFKDLPDWKKNAPKRRLLRAA